MGFSPLSNPKPKGGSSPCLSFASPGGDVGLRSPLCFCLSAEKWASAHCFKPTQKRALALVFRSHKPKAKNWAFRSPLCFCLSAKKWALAHCQTPSPRTGFSPGPFARTTQGTSHQDHYHLWSKNRAKTKIRLVYGLGFTRASNARHPFGFSR